MDTEDGTVGTRLGVNRRQLLKQTGAGVGALGLGVAGFASRPAFAGAASAHLAGHGMPARAAQAASGGTLIESTTATLEALAPLVDANRATRLLFDTLIATDAKTLEPLPNLATKWEIAADGKTYTITLQSGVTFHDGQPLTADDVKFTFDLLLNKATASPYYSIFADRIASVSADGPTTVVITLHQPVASLLSDLAAYAIGILPRHLLSAIKPENFKSSDFAQNKPVGSGPLKFKSYQAGQALTLEPNPSYHREAPKLGQYVLKFVKDSTVGYQQLKTGEASVVQISADFYDDAKTQKSFTPDVFGTFEMYMLGYNVDPKKGAPALQDVKVRQALAFAIDRQLIVAKIFDGLGTVATGTMPPISWAYQPDKLTVRYDYDPKKAGALLDEAGWKMGSGGVRAKGGTKLAFPLLVASDSKTDEGAALAIQQLMKAVGVDVTPKFEASDGAWNDRTSHNFAATLVSLTFPPDPDQSLIWASAGINGGFNIFSYNSPEVDDLLRRGLATADRTARKAIYTQMENKLLTDMPAFVLHYSKAVTGVNNQVTNYVPSAVGYKWADAFDATKWVVSNNS